MPRIEEDEDIVESVPDTEVGEDTAGSLDDFIEHDSVAGDVPPTNEFVTARLEDVIWFIELQLRDVAPPAEYAGLFKAARRAYEKLASDITVLACQAEADWKPNFRKLLKKAYGARVKLDSRKDAVRKEAVCIACGRSEERSKFRLDLAGAYDLHELCQPVNLQSRWLDFEDNHELPPVDFGVFYLGTECLRKFKTAFLLRNFMSDLINEVLCLLGEPLADGEFASGAFHEGQFVLFKGVEIPVKYQNMRSKLEYAVANRHCEPPELFLDTDFFERIDKRRTSLGLTDEMLYQRGVRVVDHGHEEGGGDDEGGLGDAGDQRCGRGEAGPSRVEEEGSVAGSAFSEAPESELDDGPATRTRTKTGAKAPAQAPAKGKGKGKGKGKAVALPIRKSKRKAAAQGQRGAPKRSARAVSDDDEDEGEDDEDEEEGEEGEAAAPAPAPAPPAAPRPPRPSLPSVSSLAALARADAKLPSRKKSLAALHHLAGQLVAKDMHEEAGIVAAAAFSAQEMMNELAQARAR